MARVSSKESGGSTPKATGGVSGDGAGRKTGSGKFGGKASLAVLREASVPHLGWLSASALALVVAAGVVLGFGQAFRLLVDSQANWENNLFLVVGLGVLLGPVSALRFYSSNRFALAVAARLEQNAFAAAITSNAPASGEQLINDAETVRSVLALEALPSVRNLLLFCGSAVMMFAVSLKLALLTLLLTLPILVLITLSIKAMRTNANRWSQSQVGLHSTLAERVSLKRIIQAFRQEATEAKQFHQASVTAHRNFFAYLRQRAILSGLVICSMALAVGVMFWQGNGLVATGGLTKGALAAFLFYAVLAAISLAGFAESASAWSRLEAALARLGGKPQFLPAAEPLEFESLEFRDVCFSYDSSYGSKPTLHKVSFKLKRGERLGLVGQSGSGKTTILHLILGFLTPQSGEILINGKPRSSHSLATVRRLFGFVPQGSSILSGSIRSNIGYGNDAGDSAMKRVLRNVGGEFVLKFTKGLATKISPREFVKTTGDGGTTSDGEGTSGKAIGDGGIGNGMATDGEATGGGAGGEAMGSGGMGDGMATDGEAVGDGMATGGGATGGEAIETYAETSSSEESTRGEPHRGETHPDETSPAGETETNPTEANASGTNPSETNSNEAIPDEAIPDEAIQRGISEGQKQRLAWARALLGDPQVLLLDEATSALDNINETTLMKNLHHKTCLVVAHRASTMHQMDWLTVLAEGRVVASGTHQTLQQTSPLYKHLASQAELNKPH